MNVIAVRSPKAAAIARILGKTPTAIGVGSSVFSTAAAARGAIAPIASPATTPTHAIAVNW